MKSRSSITAVYDKQMKGNSQAEPWKTKISAKFLQNYRDVFLSRGQLEQLNQTVLIDVLYEEHFNSLKRN